MRGLYYLIVLFLVFSCDKREDESEKALTNKAPTTEESEIRNEVKEEEFPTVENKEKVIEDAKKYSDSDSIKQNNEWLTPTFLSADFNGDNHIDTVFAVIVDGKKGIKIKHGQTGEEFILGAGNSFGNGGDDFYWLTTWHLVTDQKTFEVTFMEDGDVDGSREVVLEETAFYIGEEYGGATIAWKDGKYKWIHQAD